MSYVLLYLLEFLCKNDLTFLLPLLLLFYYYFMINPIERSNNSIKKKKKFYIHTFLLETFIIPNITFVTVLPKFKIFKWGLCGMHMTWVNIILINFIIIVVYNPNRKDINPVVLYSLPPNKCQKLLVRASKTDFVTFKKKNRLCKDMSFLQCCQKWGPKPPLGFK